MKNQNIHINITDLNLFALRRNDADDAVVFVFVELDRLGVVEYGKQMFLWKICRLSMRDWTEISENCKKHNTYTSIFIYLILNIT